MNLHSTTPGTQWRINPQGTRTLAFLDVMDSYNANSTAISVAGNNVTNSGNNAYWIFDANPPNITVDSISTPTANTLLPITGSAVESSEVVSAVQYQMEVTSGSWSSCTASDGTFDEASETFTCTPATALGEGAHIMYIRATDSDSYTTADADLTTVNFTVDTTAPVISAVASDPTTSGVTISWTTNESASSIVDYGLTSAYGSSSDEFNTTTRVTSHSISIASLDDCAAYHYRVRSKDSADNQGTSADYTFTCDIADPGSPDITDVKTESSTSLKLKIDGASGTVDHYKLEYGTKSGNYRWDKNSISEGDIDSVTVKNLSPDTAYYFRVRAVNDCGEGDWSDEESGQTDAEPESESSTATAETETTTPTPPAQTTEAVPLIPEKINFNGASSLYWQKKYFGNEYCYAETKCGEQADPDGDGLNNSDEFRLGTDPNNFDTDGDGMKDGTEIENGKNPVKVSGEQGGDEIIFESPKESGEVKKETYEVKNVEMVDVDGNKKLKLSGKGLPNSYVTIFVYSDLPTVLTVKTDKDGNWSYVLDKDLEDGQHQVYVAVTDNAGKIINKSEALSFVKTAQAVSIIAPAEVAALERAAPPTEVWFKRDIFFFVALVLGGLVLALAALGLYKYGIYKKSESSNYGNV